MDRLLDDRFYELVGRHADALGTLEQFGHVFGHDDTHAAVLREADRALSVDLLPAIHVSTSTWSV
jgi:hypothetical protein